MELGTNGQSRSRSLDAQCIIALILGAIRADRFGEGTLLAFLKDGFITKWLERLKTLDTD